MHTTLFKDPLVFKFNYGHKIPDDLMYLNFFIKKIIY